MSFREEVAWLAGLLEGEGCFTVGWNKKSGKMQTRIQLQMTDLDVVERAARLMGNARPREVRPRRRDKQIYMIQPCGTRAVGWMMILWPFMGTRRKARIREVLELWRVHGHAFRGHLCRNGLHKLPKPGPCSQCLAANWERHRLRRYGPRRRASPRQRRIA